jgi:hypothetical protein
MKKKRSSIKSNRAFTMFWRCHDRGNWRRAKHWRARGSYWMRRAIYETTIEDLSEMLALCS